MIELRFEIQFGERRFAAGATAFDQADWSPGIDSSLVGPGTARLAGSPGRLIAWDPATSVWRFDGVAGLSSHPTLRLDEEPSG